MTFTDPMSKVSYVLLKIYKRSVQTVRRLTQDIYIIFCHFSTYTPATEMHLVQHFYKDRIHCRSCSSI